MYAAAIGSRSRSRARSRAAGTRPRVSGTHVFTRYCTALAPEECNGTYKALDYTFSFSQLVQAADFTGLFDQYRIRKVILTFQLINNPDASTNLNGWIQTNLSTYPVTNWYPKLWYVIDPDGGPSETISTIKERQDVKCRILRPNKTIKVVFTPKCRVLTYSTPTSTGYSPKNIRIDMSDTSVEHFGFKGVVDTNAQDPNDNFPFKISVERKFVFSCHGVR